MRIEPETTTQLRKLLDEHTDWGQRIEQFVADYGQLKPAQVPSLPEENLRKLWWAVSFAETGSFGLSKPTGNQLRGLRTMTTLLADRSKSLGVRFLGARKVCDKSFAKTQLPVILRTLLILEGGLFGTIVTKNSTNLLLKWAGKPELNYGEPASITLALENIRALIEEWAPRVDATKLGERARIPWHLCEIIELDSPGNQGQKGSESGGQNKGWRFAKWMGPLVDALRALGGSGTPKAVNQKIQELLKVPDSVLAEKMGGSGQSRFYNEVAWARQFLVWEGLVESPVRGTWALTAEGQKTFLDEQHAQGIAKKWAERHKQTAEARPDADMSESLVETSLCELIYRNLLVSEKPGTSKFMDFVRDKRQMAILFENFVRTFYRVHTDYQVKREDIYWRWIAADQVAAGLLPKMQTDISLVVLPMVVLPTR